jgi:hypothetical protein
MEYRLAPIRRRILTAGDYYFHNRLHLLRTWIDRLVFAQPSTATVMVDKKLPIPGFVRYGGKCLGMGLGFLRPLIGRCCGLIPKAMTGASPRLPAAGGYADYAGTVVQRGRYGDDPNYRGSNLGFRVGPTSHVTYSEKRLLDVGCEPGISLCGCRRKRQDTKYMCPGFTWTRTGDQTPNMPTISITSIPLMNAMRTLRFILHMTIAIWVYGIMTGAWEVDDGYTRSSGIYITLAGCELGLLRGVGKRLPTRSRMGKGDEG